MVHLKQLKAGTCVNIWVHQKRRKFLKEETSPLEYTTIPNIYNDEGKVNIKWNNKKICLKILDILKGKLLIVDFGQHEFDMASKSVKIA